MEHLYKVKNLVSTLLVSLLLSTFAFANANEYKVQAINEGYSSSYISLKCVDKNLYFSIQWNTLIGNSGKYKRHLILPSDTLGDIHFLLKTLPNQTTTGIVDNDQQAKALVKLILQNIKTDYMILEVFPENRDKITGEWEYRKFNYNEFLRAVDSVSHDCEWDISLPIQVEVRFAYPGVDYDEN